MTYSSPTLPHPTVINGLNHIPPPPSSVWDETFSFYKPLPPGTDLPSSWGITRYYDFSPLASPSARRVLIIHGGGTCAIGVAPLAQLLTSAGNHVVIYDFYGHGLSSTPLTAHTPALMHLQILELLSHLGWSKVNLIGFSMGGSISMSFTALHERAVESLIAVGPAGLWRKSERSWWEGVSTDGFNLPGFEWLRRSKILNYIYGSNPKVNQDWKERMLNGKFDTVPVQKWEIENHQGFVASLTSLWNYVCFDQRDMFEMVRKNGTDVLVVLGGNDDVIAPDHTKKELGEIGWEGEIVVVDGATHELIRVHKEEVAAACTEFWNGLQK